MRDIWLGLGHVWGNYMNSLWVFLGVAGVWLIGAWFWGMRIGSGSWVAGWVLGVGGKVCGGAYGCGLGRLAKSFSSC